MDNYTKIFLIQKWAEDNPRFDDGFLRDLVKFMDSGKPLSEGHEDSLKRIISGFRINLEEVENKITSMKKISLYTHIPAVPPGYEKRSQDDNIIILNFKGA